jgi:hypothetical protein
MAEFSGLLMVLAVGEATDGGAGSLIVRSAGGGAWRVYVDGGFLPDGRPDALFWKSAEAIEFALGIARGLALEALE